MVINAVVQASIAGQERVIKLVFKNGNQTPANVYLTVTEVSYMLEEIDRAVEIIEQQTYNAGDWTQNREVSNFYPAVEG